MPDDSPVSDSHELSVTRHIAALPEKVWNIMVNRQEEWWCPAPWRAEFDVRETRPGGRCDMTMYGPGGEVHPNNGIYLAFEEGRRFITTDAVTGDFKSAGPFMIGIWEIEPEERDGVRGTRYTATSRHWTEVAMKQHEEMGFAKGWGACAEQLSDLCTQE